MTKLLLRNVTDFDHRYLSSVIFAFKNTLTTTFSYTTCKIISGQGFSKDRIRYNVIFTENKNLYKMKGVSAENNH